MVAHLNEWLDQCETLTTSHVMTDAEIIQSVMQKEDSTPDSEVQDTEADHGSSDITVISVAGEVPDADQVMQSAEQLVDDLTRSFTLNQLSMRRWFSADSAAMMSSLIQRSVREVYAAKRQTKLTKYFKFK